MKPKSSEGKGIKELISIGKDEWYCHFYKCPNCNEEIPHDSKFCLECGFNLKGYKFITEK